MTSSYGVNYEGDWVTCNKCGVRRKHIDTLPKIDPKTHKQVRECSEPDVCARLKELRAKETK